MQTIFYNGKIITMEDSTLKNCPEAILVNKNKIIAVGKYSDLIKFADKDATKLDLKGQCLMPGFIDSHSHSTIIASVLEFVDLSSPPNGSVKSIDDVVVNLKEELQKFPTKYTTAKWLMGYNFDDSQMTNSQNLTKIELDKVSKTLPIAVLHMSGHAVIVNSKVLDLINVNATTKDPNGGKYERFPGTNEPNGVLKETAFMENQIIFCQLLAAINIKNQKKWPLTWQKVVDVYASNGYTTIQDGLTDSASGLFLDYLAKTGNLILDVVSYVNMLDKDRIKYLIDNSKDKYKYHNHLSNRGIKLIIDGSIQLWTAWLSKPYYIQGQGYDKNWCGQILQPSDDYQNIIKLALKNDIQLLAHCNGDMASAAFINLFANEKLKMNKSFDTRPVVVHSQLLNKKQLKLMKNNEMLSTVLIDHVFYYGDFHASKTLGPTRAYNISPLRWVVDNNVNYTIHEDSPVFPPNAIFSAHIAINRLTRSNQILGPKHKLSVWEAFKALTINAAYQYHEEKQKGTITKDKIADLVILNKSPFEINPFEIQYLQVVATFKDGKKIYSK